MFGGQNLNKLSVEELEKALLLKKRQARLDRFQQLAGAGHSTNEALLGVETPAVSPPALPLAAAGLQTATLLSLDRPKAPPPPRSRSKKITDTLLLGLEIAAVVGLVVVVGISYVNLRELNSEVSIAQQQAVVTVLPSSTVTAPVLTLTQLPSGHTPPTSPGGAAPDVPLHLQKWVQPAAAPAAVLAIPLEQNSNPPTRIVIPKINVDAPVVNNITWEDLKKGVGHLPGSANPGERGNLYLAAHNDIYGEIFRYLDKLEPGDEYFIYAGEQKFRYVVKTKQIINPTNIEVMLPTTAPVATLQTCYPYLVDSHRLVVIGELAQ
jgi:sortase A